MNESLSVTDPLARSTIAPPVESAPKKHFRLAAAPDAPPHVIAAITTFEAEFDDLLARLETHPKEQWVAYRGSQRVGFGTNYLTFRTECEARYPDGEVMVFAIDTTLRCGPEETQG